MSWLLPVLVLKRTQTPPRMWNTSAGPNKLRTWDLDAGQTQGRHPITPRAMGRSASTWGRPRDFQPGNGERVKMQRRLPIRADAAGLLRLGPRPTVAQVRRVLEPQLRQWSWSPELATHALKTLATLGFRWFRWASEPVPGRD